jgi:ABC-type multidrug transport system ATPase subunit/ABC-type transporter Mla maintaining outer membrane lipid asymmetry permease subunit MlaE
METAPKPLPPSERTSGEARGPRQGPPVSIRGLTVRAGGRAILEGAEAEFPAGGLTLVVGPSGAGKSVLLRTLAGLARPGAPGIDVKGSIRIGGKELLDRPGRGPSPAGIVFQSFALFDELSAEENILFGRDHRSGRGREGPPRRQVAGDLLRELGIPRDVKVALLSGGQKQRLAIARALAFDPDLIAYDEPTSGLDPPTAARVAALIAETGRAHGKTTVVVTHDWAHFAGVASRTNILAGGRLREVPPDEIAARFEEASRPVEEPVGRRPARTLRRAGGAALAVLGLLASILAATGKAAEAALRSAVAAVPAWRSPRWGLRFFFHYLRLVASPSAWVYFGAAGVIAGFVSTYFTFKFLPFRAYTEPLLTEELLRGLGFALYRIIVPVLVTILVAARCGAAVASDVGTRRYALAIDAMESMGARPARYLLTGILYGFAIGTPFVIALAFAAARLTSLAAFVHGHPAHGPFFWSSHFHRDLWQPGSILYAGTWWLAAKVLLCGLGVGTIAYHQGMRPKHSAVDVNRGITSTIIWGTLFVLVVHFAFAFWEF